MKKLRIILCICIALVLGMCVVIFLENGETKDANKYSKSSNSRTCSEEGFFYIGNDMLIHFTSAITDEDMIFCFNPVCEHDAYSEETECMAACGNKVTFLHYHDKSLYVFNRIGLEEHRVYRIDINKGIKELVATLPFSVQGNHIIFDGSYAYYQAMIFVIGDDEQITYTYYDIVELNVTDGSYRMLLNLNEKSIFRKFDVCNGKMFAMKGEGDTEAVLYHIDLDTLEVNVVARQEELYNEYQYMGMYDDDSYYYINNVSDEIGIHELKTNQDKVFYKCTDGEKVINVTADRNKVYYSINDNDNKSKYFLYNAIENKSYELTNRIGSLKVKCYCPYNEMFVLEEESGAVDGGYHIVNENELIKELETSDMLKETSDKFKETTDVYLLEGKSNGDDEVSEEERGKGQIIDIAGANDAKRLGVSKTLVWIVPDEMCPDETTVNALNDKLVNKYGCDFVVEFHQYSLFQYLFNDKYKFADMVRDMKALGHQADILYSGSEFDYDSFVEEGIYIPFTEYFATEEGQKLYNAYAPEVWSQIERNGCTYGYLSKIYPAERAVSLCNKNVLAQYGIDIPNEKISFYDIGKYLENADMSQETLDNKAIMLACNTDALLLMEGYQEFDTLREGIFFKETDNDGWKAVDITKEENFTKLTKTIVEYANKGWYVNSSDIEKTVLKGKNDIELIGNGRYAFYFYYSSPTAIVDSDNKLLARVINGRNTEIVITDVTVLDEAYAAIEPISNMINGVTSWSEYTAEALELITLINTEAELSNLLEYGIEGEDYKYGDRRITSLKSDKGITIPTIGSLYANMNLLHSVFIEPDDKLAYSKEISLNYKKSPTLMYDFDLSAYETQLEAISEITEKYIQELFMGYCTDVDATIEAMRKELAVAGIDEVIAEINRQMQ